MLYIVITLPISSAHPFISLSSSIAIFFFCSLFSVVIYRCSTFFSAGMMNNKVTTFLCAHITFIS